MTTVEMLWEPVDPALALRERFGHDSVASAVAWVSNVLADDYGRSLHHCERIVLSDGNALAWVTAGAQESFIVKWSVKAERFARLRALAKVTDWLARDAALPVSAPVPTPDGRLHVERDAVSLGVQRVLSGDLLDVTNADEVFAAGKVLADLHTALARCPHAGLLRPPEPSSPLRDQVLGWSQAPDPHLATQAVRALRGLVLDADPNPLTRQLVHGDYRSANVLMNHGNVSGILDFEEARWDHPIVELARQAVLLGTQYHNWGPVPRATQEHLRAGYETIRPLSQAEASWWQPLLLWFTLLLTPPGDDPTGWGRSVQDQLRHIH